jgi:uncharacterized phiE125 gp8 family phage protein
MYGYGIGNRGRVGLFDQPGEIRSGLLRTVNPAFEPFLLADVKSHLRVDIGDDDSYIKLLIATARGYVESYIGKALYQQTWRYTMDYFPTGVFPRTIIRLPIPPLVSITSITYVDTNGVTQTVDPTQYRVVIMDVGTVAPVFTNPWPVPLIVDAAVNITFVSGYNTVDVVDGDPSKTIPPAIKHAMLLVVGNLYENREGVVIDQRIDKLPFGIEALLAPHRVNRT